MGGKILEKWRKKLLKKAENFEGPSSSEGNHITPTNCKIFLDVVMRLESLPTDSKNNRDRAQEGLRRRENRSLGFHGSLMIPDTSSLPFRDTLPPSTTMR